MWPAESVNRRVVPSAFRAWATRWPPCIARSLAGKANPPPRAGTVPLWAMPLFRKRDGGGGGATRAGQGRAPARRAVADEPDWRAYDSVAEAYAAVQQPRMALPAADLVELAEVGAGARVLDVGTGTGVVARAAVATAGPDGLVVGVDV